MSVRNLGIPLLGPSNQHRPMTMDGRFSNDLNLTTERDVRAYLEKTPYKSTDIIPLSGGLTNYVFRLKLVTPYLGRETLVLKHATSYVKDYQMVAVELDRQVSGVYSRTENTDMDTILLDL
jgi:hypothetical protein